MTSEISEEPCSTESIPLPSYLYATPRRWRIYFNSKLAYPHIWSVDEGSSESEILVRWFHFREC